MEIASGRPRGAWNLEVASRFLVSALVHKSSTLIRRPKVLYLLRNMAKVGRVVPVHAMKASKGSAGVSSTLSLIPAALPPRKNRGIH